ncbi:hypothetical protein HMI54_002972 [Coelomomyces lativittatus]|nr:hypothetical protein HMI54_002972 [Coelomomyces lativittatus]
MTDMIQLHDSTMTIQISCFDALKDIPNPVQKMKISLNLQVLMNLPLENEELVHSWEFQRF